MKEINFVAEKGNVDINGNKIILSGMKIPKNVLLTKDFDKKSPLGIIKEIINDGNDLNIKAEIFEHIQITGLYPAIGVQVFKRSNQDGIQTWEETQLEHVALCSVQNADTSIQPLD